MKTKPTSPQITRKRVFVFWFSWWLMEFPYFSIYLRELIKQEINNKKRESFCIQLRIVGNQQYGNRKPILYQKESIIRSCECEWSWRWYIRTIYHWTRKGRFVLILHYSYSIGNDEENRNKYLPKTIFPHPNQTCMCL